MSSVLMIQRYQSLYPFVQMQTNAESFSGVKSWGKHGKICGDLCKQEFPGGYCAQTSNTFQRLNNNGINVRL